MSSYQNFFSMPFPLKIVFIAGFCSPLIAIGSILTGTVLPPNSLSFDYGAAKNLGELVVVIGATIPISVVSIFMLLKRKRSLLFFPFGYIAACLGPIFLSAFRADIDYMISSVLSSFAVGGLASIYLLRSREVKSYFQR